MNSSLRSRHPRLHHCAVVLAALSIAGCGDTDDGVPPDAAPAVPRFEPGACRYKLGPGQIEGTTVRCGDLVVPARRDGAPSSELRLHVLRFGGERLSVAPILWLEGGPGGDVDGTASLPVDITAALTGDRDFIVFSQRGAGQSTPLADCPEAKQVPSVGNPDPVAFEAEIDAAFLKCRDRLVAAHVDLAAFSSRESADDVDDLRKTFGYTQINLLGTSYGSRLALEVMRRHGPTVRAAVIDAIAPPNTPWLIQAGATFQAALTDLLAKCDHAPACKTAFGSPMLLAANAFATLEARPLMLPGPGIALNGRDILGLTFQLMYDADALPIIPLMLAAARDRDAATLEKLLTRGLGDVATNGAGTAVAMQTSVDCNDQVRFLTASDVDAQYATLRPEIVATFKRHTAGDVERCTHWPLAAPDPGLTAAVHSDVPTLIFSGNLDPITPPKFGTLVGETLSNARHIVFPVGAHGNSIATDCGRGLTLGFFDQPAPAALDTSCSTQVTAIDFLTEPPPAPPAFTSAR